MIFWLHFDYYQVEIVGKGDEKESKYCGNPRKAEVRKVKRVSKNQKRIPAEVPNGFVHVRARRGQATDSHSLAERVIKSLNNFLIMFNSVKNLIFFSIKLQYIFILFC